MINVTCNITHLGTTKIKILKYRCCASRHNKLTNEFPFFSFFHVSPPLLPTNWKSTTLWHAPAEHLVAGRTSKHKKKIAKLWWLGNGPIAFHNPLNMLLNQFGALYFWHGSTTPRFCKKKNALDRLQLCCQAHWRPTSEPRATKSGWSWNVRSARLSWWR